MAAQRSTPSAPSGNLARPKPLPSEQETRLQRAWTRHPAVAFFRHRNQLSFYRQFHTLLRAGTPLPTTFLQLGKYASEPGLAKALAQVSADLQRGQSLAQAMSAHGAQFNDVNVELIAFAEEAGTLDRVLAQLVEHLEATQKLRWRAIFMSLWPMYLLAALVFVGPLLGAAGHAKSAGDVGAIYVVGLLRNLFFAGTVVLGVFSFPLGIALAGKDAAWDRLKRRALLVRGAVRDAYAARFAMGLGLSLGAGLEIRRALNLAAKATGSPSVLESLPRAHAVLERGDALADAVEQLELFDRASLGTLSVGERTGTLSSTLEKLSQELNEASLRSARVVMMVVLVLVVGLALFVAVGGLLGVMFGPIKTLYDAAGSGKMEGMGN